MKHAVVVIVALFALAAPASAQRLPGDVIPDQYTLWFAPDFRTDTFRGRETIRVQLTKPSAAIMLHAAEIEFSDVRVTASGSAQVARVTLDEKTETATLQVPQMLPAGSATIDITYSGILNDQLRGFYLSKANGRKYAVTQMEATDARRAFPCFDEPAYKATFEISLTIDEGDTAISNGAQISDTPGPEPGKHTLRFAPTLKMSTYLVAMVVGDFVCRGGSADGIPIRVCSTPDKKALTGFALEAAEHQMTFYNEYYGIKYPFGKLDIIGVPDFAAGAMENTGAITFRERLLLADPDRASLSVRKNIAAILSHEIAHQWFGNLVTMKWWDDIWLNEGFATWMENKPLAAWRPEWHVELDEVEATQKALALDTLRSTRPIRTQVETPEEINEVFDAIAYEKSAGVIRMIGSYLGGDVFRRSVASYLKTYSFSNAAAEDFWNEVTRVSGKPVDRIMASFVDQAGVPALSVSTRCHGSNTAVELRQERFIGTPALRPGSGQGASSPKPQTWTLPVCMRGGTNGDVKCEVMSQPRQTFTQPACSTSVNINPGSRGYYFSEYTPRALTALTLNGGRLLHPNALKNARWGPRLLAPTERLGLIGDEWWMVKAGRHDVGLFLDLASDFSAETTADVVEAVVTRLAVVGEDLVSEPQQPRFRQWIRARFGPAFEELGFPGRRDDDDERQSRRAAWLELLGVTGDADHVQKHAREVALEYISDPASLSGTLAPKVLQVAAFGGDAALYDRYLSRMKGVASDPEEYYRFFNALPDFRDPALIRRTLELSISDDVRTQDTATLIAGLLVRPWAREAAWSFVKTRWDTLTRRLGTFQGIPIIISAVGSFCSPLAAADVKEFFAKHPVKTPERTLRQSIEKIESCAAFHKRQAPALTRWLQASGTFGL